MKVESNTRLGLMSGIDEKILNESVVMNNSFEYQSNCLINKEVKSETIDEEGNDGDDYNMEEAPNSTDHIRTDSTAEEDSQCNEAVDTSFVKSDTQSGQSVSAPKPSPLVIMPTIGGISNIKDGKLMPNRTIYLIKTTSPNPVLTGGSIPTSGQLMFVKNGQIFKVPFSKSAITGRIEKEGQGRPKVPKSSSDQHSPTTSVGTINQINMTKGVELITTKANQQNDQVSASGDEFDPKTQQVVYRCPFMGCDQYNEREEWIKSHMRLSHKIKEPTPLKQVFAKQQVLSIAGASDPSTKVLPIVDASDPSTKEAVKVYKCPFKGCSNYNRNEKVIKLHMTNFHKTKCNTPLEPVDLAEVKPAQTTRTQTAPKGCREAYKCGQRGCQQTFLTESSIKQHLMKEHKIADEQRALSSIISLVPEASLKNMTKKKIKDYIEMKKKEYFIPNSSFGKNKVFSSQARELIINMALYFELRHPDWNKQQLLEEISKATKIKIHAVHHIYYSFKKHKKIVEPKIPDRSDRFQYKCSDEDRDVLLQCMYKLKDENRLKGILEVYYEIMKSDEFKPSFKGCKIATFYRLFAGTGLKISETMIINRKPELITKEKGYGISPLKSSSGLWECDWPGCDKKFKLRDNMIEHIRCHTDDKPFECIFPKCQYKCRTMSNIKNHQRSHNKDN